jgi:putative membrane protein insertion efficiency factor
MQRLNKNLKWATIGLIRGYQILLSPDHSFWRFVVQKRVCCFHPTCSEYAIEAIEKYGVSKGTALAVKRISRCHPFSDGGYDPVK